MTYLYERARDHMTYLQRDDEGDGDEVVVENDESDDGLEEPDKPPT